MPEPLITFTPKSRIKDLFVSPGSKLNFAPADRPFKDRLIQGQPNLDYRDRADFYQKIAIDIVAETVMDYPYPMISEKTYRPIINYRPFIIVGPAHTLKFLRSLGFSTFSSIIDESYDTLLDAEERFYRVSEEIKKFIGRPIDEIKQDVSSVSSILIHNATVLSTMVDQQLQLFKEQIKID